MQLPVDAKVDEKFKNHEVKAAAEVHRGFTVEKECEFLCKTRMVRSSVFDKATQSFASFFLSVSYKLATLELEGD